MIRIRVESTQNEQAKYGGINRVVEYEEKRQDSRLDELEKKSQTNTSQAYHNCDDQLYSTVDLFTHLPSAQKHRIDDFSVASVSTESDSHRMLNY